MQILHAVGSSPLVPALVVGLFILLPVLLLIMRSGRRLVRLIWTIVRWLFLPFLSLRPPATRAPLVEQERRPRRRYRLPQGRRARSASRIGLEYVLAVYIVYAMQVAIIAPGATSTSGWSDGLAQEFGGLLGPLSPLLGSALFDWALVIALPFLVVGRLLFALPWVGVHRLGPKIAPYALADGIESWAAVEMLSLRHVPALHLYVARPLALGRGPQPIPFRRPPSRLATAGIIVAGLVLPICLIAWSAWLSSQATHVTLGEALIAVPASLALGLLIVPLIGYLLVLLKPSRERRMGYGLAVADEGRMLYLVSPRRSRMADDSAVALEAFLAPLVGNPPLPEADRGKRQSQVCPAITLSPPPAGWPPLLPTIETYRRLPDGLHYFQEALRIYRHLCVLWARDLMKAVQREDLRRPPVGVYLATYRASHAQMGLLDALLDAGLPAEVGLAVPNGSATQDPIHANYWPDVALRDATDRLLIDVEVNGSIQGAMAPIETNEERDDAFYRRGWYVIRVYHPGTTGAQWESITASLLLNIQAQHGVAVRIARLGVGLDSPETHAELRGSEPVAPDPPPPIELQTRRKRRAANRE